MPSSHGIRAFLALGLAALTALVSLLIGGDVQVSLVVLVGAVAATLIAASSETDVPASIVEPVPQASGPAVGEVIDAIAEPVLVIDANRVIEANPAARALLGQHILGEDVRLAIRHPAAAERLLDPTDQSPAAPIHLVGLGTRDQRWEMRVRTLENGQRIVHLIDRTGSYATERIRVDFVANASHELRTPLASLLGYVETLQDDAGDDPATRQRFLKIMHDEARRMQRLIDDLISLSRIEAEKYRAPADTIALGDLIEEVCIELSGAARAADLVTEVEEVPPVRGDRAQLSQLVHNVVGNAMKYGKHGTPVTIVLRREGDAMVRLTVVDQGEGIPPEHIPRLTERFYRVDSGRSRSLGGTGLGLAIVKHIVERHRGRMDIASTVGKGTTVSVLLPIQRMS
ncbi:PAS domain-containing protein [Sphingomonas sp. JC676]|uniref:ATP-binding protein n=1 Tax=Sphingomonas sp. JC676 TaxID=2768065 RepID=UPI001657916E|nr:ATP-binding protein [Sphingomonas sp. JC676]MBC9030897.1 PAS domain-containing protein [Sphingomonas sp. JC676]